MFNVHCGVRPAVPGAASDRVTRQPPIRHASDLSAGRVNKRAAPSPADKDDPLEHEADRLAEVVMRTSNSPAPIAAPRLRSGRQCEKCAEEGKPQMKQESSLIGGDFARVGTHSDSIRNRSSGAVDTVLTGGKALDVQTRRFMEDGFQHDFSRVKVFTDATAARVTSELGARAFAFQNRIAFATGQFSPGTSDGRRLIAHELVHVMQQERNGFATPQRKTDPDQEGPGGRSVWDQAFELADNSRWEEVAELVNGFSAEHLKYFIQSFKGQPASISQLYLGAIGNRKVGADSQVARATRSTYLDVSFAEQVNRSAWSRAAYFMNGFAADDMKSRLGKLETAKLKLLHEGAATNAELGVDSAVAKLSAQALADRSARGDAKALLLPTLRGEGKDALIAVMRVIDDIHPAPDGSAAFTMVVDGQPQKITAAQALQIRNGATSVLRDHLTRVETKAATALNRYQSQSDIDKQHWIVAPIVKTLGRVKDPGPDLLAYANRALADVQAARGAIEAKHLVAAASLMASGESAAIAATKMWQAYFEGVIGAAEMTVTVLEITRDASFITLGILATIATGGAAAGVLGAAEGTTAFGVALGVSEVTAANVIAVGAPIVANLGEAAAKVSMGDNVDWGALVIDTAIQILIARFGGKLTGGIAKTLLGNPATERLAGQVTEKLVHAVILHAGSVALTTAVQDVYRVSKGKQITWQNFIDEVIEHLTDPKSLAVLALTTAVGSAAEARYGGARPVTPKPSGEAPRVTTKTASEGTATPTDISTGSAPSGGVKVPPGREPPIPPQQSHGEGSRPLRGASAGGVGSDFTLDVWNKLRPPVEQRKIISSTVRRPAPKPVRTRPSSDTRSGSTSSDIADVIRETTQGTASLGDRPVERSLGEPSKLESLGLPTSEEPASEGSGTAGHAEPHGMSIREEWVAPKGARARPPLNAPKRTRVAWLRQRLQMHVDQAAQRYQTEGLTPNQEEAVWRDPDRLARDRGSRIDQFAKDTIMQDPELAELILAPDFIGDPDLIDSVQPVWFDITTRGQWRAHVRKYGARYGARWGYLLPTN